MHYLSYTSRYRYDVYNTVGNGLVFQKQFSLVLFLVKNKNDIPQSPTLLYLTHPVGIPTHRALIEYIPQFLQLIGYA